MLKWFVNLMATAFSKRCLQATFEATMTSLPIFASGLRRPCPIRLCEVEFSRLMGAAKSLSKKIVEDQPGLTAKSSYLGLATRDLADWVSRLDAVPTLPVVAMKVNEHLASNRSSAQSIAELLRQDIALSSRILRLVNSSYYAIPGGVADVRKAITFLGFQTIAQLILGLSVFSVFEKSASAELSLHEFWKFAMTSAALTEKLARAVGYQQPEVAYTAGLLQDLGKLALITMAPEPMAKMLRWVKSTRTHVCIGEKEWSLPRHEEVGENLANRWKLPPEIVGVIAHHHDEIKELGGDLKSQQLLACVQLANHTVTEMHWGSSGSVTVAGTAKEVLIEFLNLDQSWWLRNQAEFETEREKVEVLLNAYL